MAHRTAFVITRAPADAEDAAQAAFVKAYRALPRFRSGAAFRPWLLRIVVNEARNQRRSSLRRAQMEWRLAEQAEVVGPSPEGAVLARESLEDVLRALGALREDDRLIIAYRYFLDLSEADVAEVLRVPRGTVKSRLSRALGRLRASLGTGDVARAGGAYE